MASHRTYHSRQNKPVQNNFGFASDLYREAFIEIDEMASRALFDAETVLYQCAGERAVADLRAQARRTSEPSVPLGAARGGAVR